MCAPHSAWRSAVGLLDDSDPESGKRIREKLDALGNDLGPHYPRTVPRTIMECATARPDTGRSLKCTCCFRTPRPWEKCTGLATLLEERLPVELGKPAEVITHLESLEDHEHLHSTEHYTGRRDS